MFSFRLLGIEEAVEVHDDVLDVGLVDARLAGAAPCLQGRFVAGRDANRIEVVGIHEINTLGVANLSAENQM